MAAADLIIVAIAMVLGSLYFFRASLFGAGGPSASTKLANGSALGAENGEDEFAGDFVAKLEKQVRTSSGGSHSSEGGSS